MLNEQNVYSHVLYWQIEIHTLVFGPVGSFRCGALQSTISWQKYPADNVQSVQDRSEHVNALRATDPKHILSSYVPKKDLSALISMGDTGA